MKSVPRHKAQKGNCFAPFVLAGKTPWHFKEAAELAWNNMNFSMGTHTPDTFLGSLKICCIAKSMVSIRQQQCHEFGHLHLWNTFMLSFPSLHARDWQVINKGFLLFYCLCSSLQSLYFIYIPTLAWPSRFSSMWTTSLK